MSRSTAAGLVVLLAAWGWTLVGLGGLRSTYPMWRDGASSGWYGLGMVVSQAPCAFVVLVTGLLLIGARNRAATLFVSLVVVTQVTNWALLLAMPEGGGC